ncbi:MAG: hypothetical protein ABSD56_00050 [Bryobacteraceae bacterium]
MRLRPMSDTYICAQCGGTFSKVRDDDEALEEYRETFPEWMRLQDRGEPAIVCDDCWRKMMA